MRRTRLLLLALLALLPLGGLGGCGGGAGGRGGFSSDLPGPLRLALPVFLDGAIKTLALRNLVDTAGTVNVISVPGATTPVNVPARGEARLILNAFSEGWVVVDTTPTAALRGFVEAYLHTERSGPDRESVYGALLQTAESVIPVHPNTDRVSLLNFSAVPVTYRVRSFGASDGVTNPELLPSALVPLAANTSFNLDAALTAIQGQFGVGHISVVPEPAVVFGAGEGFTLAAHQDTGLVVEVDDRDENRQNTSRLLDPTSTSAAEWMVEFGRDPATGGYEDFDLVVSNFTGDSDVSFTVNGIYDEFGAAVKTTPRTFQVPARQSRLLATTTVGSLGLQVGETHPFAHAFGDVFISTDRRLYRMRLSIDRRLLLSGRVFDPLAPEFATGVRPTGVRRTTSVLMSDLQSTLAGGVSNWAYLSNPSDNAITVQVRAHTREKGTEYQLPSFVIPPGGIYRFRGDALHLKEDPGVPILADVPIVRFLFSSNSPFGSRGRGEARSGSELLLLVTPHIVRHEE